MHYTIIFSLLCFVVNCADAFYTGPDGRLAVEGTPEFEANKYLRKIFIKYGIDFDTREQMGEHELAELMRNIGLGIIHKLPKVEKGEEEDHHDHDRKKRDANGEHDKPEGIVATWFADSVSSIPHYHENVSNVINSTNCRSAPLLLHEYNMKDYVMSDTGIGTYEFGMICPALIYLTDEKTCIERELEVEKEKPSALTVWGYGILSITVISLLSFLGVAIVPLISSHFFQTLLSILVAGAVGALSGDALLHLLPHSQSSSHLHSKEPVFKNLSAIGGIYFLFVVEGIMKIMHQRSDRRKQKKKLAANEYKSESKKFSRSSRGSDECVFVGPDGKLTGEDEDGKPHPDMEKHDHGRHAHEHTHDHGDLTGKGVASVAWMVIAGDGMHNFSDGVAIGAAFSASLVGGMSTSLAVFCHELPHELGDFAMLLKAGMTIKQALFYNAFAASLGYLGMILGILIGNYAATVTPWIFAITAGMFLYVALVDMLPEMNSGMADLSTRDAVRVFILQNIGLLVGFGIMLIIALFEDQIEFE